MKKLWFVIKCLAVVAIIIIGFLNNIRLSFEFGAGGFILFLIGLIGDIFAPRLW